MNKQKVMDLLDEFSAASNAVGFYQGQLTYAGLSGMDLLDLNHRKDIAFEQMDYLRQKLYVELGLTELVLEPDAT